MELPQTLSLFAGSKAQQLPCSVLKSPIGTPLYHTPKNTSPIFLKTVEKVKFLGEVSSK